MIKSITTTPRLTRNITTSLLSKVQSAPPDKILGLTDFYNRDTNPQKVNLTVGIYKDNNGKVTTFPSVAKAQHIIDTHSQLNKNLSYLPIVGNSDYSKHVLDFLFKDSCPNEGHQYLSQNKINFIQTLSGTGAIAITAKFISTFLSREIWVPNYSWANHINIFQNNGFNKINRYDYYDPQSGTISLDKWLSSLKSSHKHNNNTTTTTTTPQCILLHACCHNPTGVDPTRDQWEQIIDSIHELGMIPIIDMAYQGLESGHLTNDAYLLRMCLQRGHWDNGLYLCQSFAKNMGLYGERVGSLSIVTPLDSHGSITAKIDSQLKPIIRSVYSSPPGYGSRVANQVLADPVLKQQWFKDVQGMVDRLHSIRLKLFDNLKWPDLIDWERQHGMFYFTRFTTGQVDLLKNKYSIYLTQDGRLSLSGVNDSNIDYISDALFNVAKENI